MKYAAALLTVALVYNGLNYFYSFAYQRGFYDGVCSVPKPAEKPAPRGRKMPEIKVASGYGRFHI